MNDNIALITENVENLEYFLSNITIFRRCNSISDISISNIRKYNFENCNLILLNKDEYSENEIFKILDIFKKINLNIPIVLVCPDINSESVFDLYQNGIYDFITPNMPIKESEIKLLNCLKFKSLSDYSDILNNFVKASNCIIFKTGLFTHKALKEVFDYLTEFKKFKDACYVILSLDERTKTKVSMNRLGQNLKKYLRKTDIAAQGTGKFYLVLPNTDLKGAEFIVDKISDSMGKDIKIHSGIAQIGYRNIFEVEKVANDSLKSAIIKDKLYVSIENNFCIDENLGETSKNDKRYKLFQKSFENKLSSVIEPVFFRYERDLISKRPDLYVSQYSNLIESVFSIKSDTSQSELSLRYDGFAKFNTQISHKGLETSENSSFVVPLNKLNEKSLLKILNRFYSEFADNITD